jgi:TPR repeat protein
LNPQPDPVAEPKAAPAAALPATVETPKTEAPAADNDQTRTLISRGDHLMSLGDLAAAREFYMEALKLGAAPTTLLQVGMTYDPVVYAANKVAGLSPDKQMALQFYRQADQAGVTAARDAIARLEAWTQN